MLQKVTLITLFLALSILAPLIILTIHVAQPLAFKSVRAAAVTPIVNPSLQRFPRQFFRLIPSPTPTRPVSPTLPLFNEEQQFLMDKINEFRLSHGLSTVSIDSKTCQFASIRAKEISRNFSHDGFTSRLATNQLPYASYTLVTENIAQNSRYQDIVDNWSKSPVHSDNMQKDTPFVCVSIEGSFVAYEGWKP